MKLNKHQPIAFISSPQQRAAWHCMAQKVSSAAIHVLSAPCDLPEPELRFRLSSIVEQEEILRTTFEVNEEGRGLVQCLNGPHTLTWGEPLQIGNSDHRAGIERLHTIAAMTPPPSFDIKTGPLLKVRLVHGENGARVLLTASPLIVDRESLIALSKRLCGSPSRPSQIRYRDYARWRADLLSSDENAVESGMWHESPTRNPLGTRGTVEEGRCCITHQLELAALSATPGYDRSSEGVLLSLWSLYLARATGLDRVVIAVRQHGRAAPQLEHAIGPFAQYLPVSFDVPAEDSVETYLVNCLAKLRDAVERQDYAAPLDLVENRTWCACDEYVSTGAEVVWEEPVPAALAWRAVVDAQGARIEISADPEVYTHQDLTRLVNGFDALLRAAGENPRAPIRSLSCVTPEEANLLNEMGTNSSPASELDVVACFRNQARQSPLAIAAVVGTLEFTYAELDARSDAMANAIDAEPRCKHVSNLPIFASASPEWLWLALGVLKSGRSFVPLDPSHPRARVRATLQALGADFALTTPEFAPELEGICDALVLRDVPGALPASLTDLDSVAYVMFTSGSTGIPNGVRVTHRGLANYLDWAAAEYGLDQRYGALVHTSPAFDLTLTSLFGPLVCGGHVIFQGRESSAAALLQALRSTERLGMVKTTPSLLRTVCSMLAGQTARASVSTIILGGEALTGLDLERFRALFATARIYNEYGPTETVVGCCVFDATNWVGTGPVPIGKPISATRLLVKDSTGAAAPVGAVGELYIQGPGVALGYVSGLDAHRFLVLDGQRTYRSGDLVRYLADGNLEFVGRIDDELKINGVRTTPREVAAAMERIPGVATALACMKNDSQGMDRLVGYYVRSTQSAPLGDSELRGALSGELIAALIPAMFCEIESFPLNANGKIEYERLPNPFLTTAPLYEGPRDQVEETLVAVLSSVLGTTVGLNDNYFALGGDSLHSVRATALARRRGLNVSVAQLHATPLVRDLAQAVRSGDPLLDVSPRTRAFDLLDESDRSIMPEEIEDAYPLNLLQEGMIYHREFSPKSAVYHAICSYTIRAKLDLELMQEVIRDLVARHALLRTSFDLTTYSRPLQLVHSSFETPLEIVDLADASESAFHAAVNGWIEHEKAVGFELTEYPLIRYCVHRWHDDVFQLSYSFHHEIIDGWSDAYMVTELLRDYFARLNGESFVPPLLGATFRDAVMQEREALSNAAFREFWLKALGDAKLMRLPRLKGREKVDKGEREIVKFEVPVSQELSDSLKALARELAVPLKTVLLAAHMRVMAHLGGGKDTMTYTVGNGRPENSAGHGVIGLFVNSLAFWLHMPGGTWSELILATLAKEQSLLPYRRYPMAELKRQAGNEPLSETLFFFNHYHVADVFDGRTDASLLGIKVYGESTFPYCINAYVEPVSKRVGMRIEYDSLQYSPGLMATIEQAYLIVLRSMVSDPEGRYDADCLLAPAELNKLCLHWNGTAPSTREAVDVLRLIERGMRETPDRIAIIHESGHVSYRALDQLSARIATALNRCGIGAWSRVALCVGRDSRLIALMLGVMRAGAAYVPIDPTLPEARQRAVLKDAAPDLTVVESLASWHVDSGHTLQLASLIHEATKLEPTATVPMPPESPAYLIYTSGTTGNPKGVAVSRGALARSTATRLAYYQDRVDAFLLLSSYAFDSSVAGIFGTLSCGGALVLPSGKDTIEPADLLELVGRHAVSHALTIPSLYAALLREVRGAAFDSLHTIILAGESLPADVLNCHMATLPDVSIVNEYGPTEATVWATAFRATSPIDTSTVPCGRPIPGVQGFVIDAFQQLAPTGVAGELHLAGPTLADGYHGAPAATAEVFVPCSFGTTPGQRMYRTGDLVRWNASGQLEFLGRCDRQVKINGFRVELGEVEAALTTHPHVKTCAVQAKMDANNEARLVAYAIPESGATLEPQQLAHHVREILPKFMLPSAYVILDRLPTLASGKLDIGALPQPGLETFEKSRAAYKAPRTNTEEVITGIWASALGLDRVGVDDNFYELGGDSLRAMRVVAAIHKAFGVQISVRIVMVDDSSVAKLGLFVDSLLRASGDKSGKQRDDEEFVLI